MANTLESEGIRRVWMQGGEEVNILTRWRFVRQLSWSTANGQYGPKLWIKISKRSGGLTKTWIDADSEEEAEALFEQAVELCHRDTGEEIDILRSDDGGQRTSWLEPLTPSQRRARAAQEAREAKDDWTPPPSESLGEPPDYDPNDNPF